MSERWYRMDSEKQSGISDSSIVGRDERASSNVG
jgi:hypothetical protein